jgi:hypothetical protein
MTRTIRDDPIMSVPQLHGLWLVTLQRCFDTYVIIQVNLLDARMIDMLRQTRTIASSWIHLNIILCYWCKYYTLLLYYSVDMLTHYVEFLWF